MPDIAGRRTWQRSRDELLAREKAHTREGDAPAGVGRRLPMTQVPADATVGGPIPFLEIFQGRRMLVACFHMWLDGQPWEGQCEGCTFCASHLLRLEYLQERDVTAVVLSQGSYAESKPYVDFLSYPAPWYSARVSETLLAGRQFGFIACYLRTDEHAYETYWTTDRGTEAAHTSYHQPHHRRPARTMGKLAAGLAAPTGRPAPVASTRTAHPAMVSNQPSDRAVSDVLRDPCSWPCPRSCTSPHDRRAHP